MEKKNNSNIRILMLLFIGVLMGALDISIVGPIIPSVEKSMQVAPRIIGWMFSIYVLFNLIGIPLFAKLSDILGRRTIYIVSVFIFALGSVVVSFADTFSTLLVGRAIQGFGASGIFPVASAVVGDIFPPEKRGRILGIIGAVFGLAFVIGPMLAGLMLTFFSWQALFLINIPIAIFLIIGAIRVLPNRKVAAVTSFDWKGVLLLALLLASFSYGINQINAQSFVESFTSLDVYPYLLAFVLFLTLFIFVEKKVASPVVKTEIFTRKQVQLVALIATGTGFMQASFVFIPKYTVGEFGVTSAAASFMLVPLVLATAIGSPLFGRMIDKIGSKLVILIGLLLPALGFIVLAFSSNNIVLFYFTGLLIGLGLSILSGSSLRYIMLNEVSSEHRASTQGIVTIFVSIGQLLGGAAIGVLIAREGDESGYKYLFLMLTIMLMILFVLSFGLKNRHDELKSANRN